MDSFSILIVDDEKVQRDMVCGFLRKEGFQVLSAAGGEEALEILRSRSIDLVLTDFRMPGLSGFELLQEARKVNPEIPVVIVTAYGTVDSAVQAMKEGAYDYLTKPIQLDELLQLIRRAEERQHLVQEVKELKEKLVDRFRFDNIVGSSGKMQEVFSLVARVAASDSTVLIRGESGTGKELIAKAIHYNSPRSRGPFIKVNIAALPETLLESELFGHEKGAFTGATEMRRGRFEAAHGGTLFLDEIGDLSPSLQVKILRVLQEREFERLGSTRSIKVDIRILAATNQNLEEAIQEKRFREDLYYRLNVVPIFLPPLRERREDIPDLLDHLLRKFSQAQRKKVEGINREAMDLLLKYNYPGNVRELENLLERAVILTRHNIILPEDLPAHIREPLPTDQIADLGRPEKNLTNTVEQIEKQMIRRALEDHGRVQVRAAEELGISERVLRYKMKKYGL